jgi:hypothetical protein
MIEFFKTVFIWVGFIAAYMAVVVGVAKLLKAGRIDAFGPDCAICGYGKMAHDEPKVPDYYGDYVDLEMYPCPDYYVDLEMSPCDTYVRGE